MKTAITSLVLITLCLGFTRPDPTSYSGDGLTVRVIESTDAGDMRGELTFNGKTYPFTAKHTGDGDAVNVNGSFTANGDSFAFTAKTDAGSDVITFTSGGKTYRLRPAVNPIENQQPPIPAPQPAPQPAPPQPDPNRAAAPNVLRVKLAAFPDATMGAPIAHMAIIPEDWNARGQIEWNSLNGDQPFPQQKIEISSPQGGRIRFTASASSNYISAPGQAPQGEPAPQNFPQWFIAAIPRMNPKVGNVQLVNAQRNEKLETMLADNDRKIGALSNGTRRECWVITLDYDEDNVRRREEMAIMYTAFPPFNGINGFQTQTWAIFPGMMISAPVDRFEAHKAELYRVGGTVRPTPQWFTHSQAMIAEMSRRKVEGWQRTIAERGRRINEMSDADYARYKQTYSSSNSTNSDGAQRTRINTIYETDDFKDTDGKIVNLPMHYHHVFSDGNGRYVLSNNSHDKPGELWNEIKPMK